MAMSHLFSVIGSTSRCLLPRLGTEPVGGSEEYPAARLPLVSSSHVYIVLLGSTGLPSGWAGCPHACRFTGLRLVEYVVEQSFLPLVWVI